MFKSNDFKETQITIDGKTFKMEYVLTTTIPGGLHGFGNIYIDPDNPMEFTFMTINNKISGYVPMNLKKEFISNIVSTVVGHELPFE